MSTQPHIYSISPRKRGLSAEECLLRKTGDWRSYSAMMNSGAIDVPPFFRKMINYYEGGIRSLETMKPENEGLLIATSVWGNEYVSRFLTLCLPSLLEERNIKALKKVNARIFINTNASGRDVISNHPAVLALVNEGVNVQLMLLNDEILEMMRGILNAKYWHLGMTQSMHLQYAKRLNIDYHLMMPDVVYSSGYFERLFSIDKSVITHGCISVDQQKMPFDKYRNGLSITIPPAELMSLSLLHTHPRAEHHFVKKNGNLPRIHLLIFEAENEVSIMTPHQSIAYISRDIIAKIPDRIFFTLDSELDKIVGNNPIYTPCAEDALVMCEVSGDNVEIYERKEVKNIEEYCVVFRQRIPEYNLYPLFLQKMAFPIDRDMLGERWYMDDDQMNAIKSNLKETLCLDSPK